MTISTPSNPSRFAVARGIGVRTRKHLATVERRKIGSSHEHGGLGHLSLSPLGQDKWWTPGELEPPSQKSLTVVVVPFGLVNLRGHPTSVQGFP